MSCPISKYSTAQASGVSKCIFLQLRKKPSLQIFLKNAVVQGKTYLSVTQFFYSCKLLWCVVTLRHSVLRATGSKVILSNKMRILHLNTLQAPCRAMSFHIFALYVKDIVIVRENKCMDTHFVNE